MLVVWEKPNKEVYYKYVKGLYYDYDIGLVNQYNHKVILVIKGYSPYTRVNTRKKLLCKVISFLKKIERG